MKVIGIDGIYFKSDDPERLKAWYAQHLDVRQSFYGNDVDNPSQHFCTAWIPVQSNDERYLSHKKTFAFSYRVDDLKALLASLNTKGIKSGAIEEIDGQKRSHVFDPDGNKVMLAHTVGVMPPNTRPATRVTGLGGVFFKAPDSKSLGMWYKENLGFDVTEWGCSFQWNDPMNPGAETPASTAWSIFAATSNYFAPSKKEFMLNYRVKDLNALLASLKAEGVELVGDPQEFSYGKFGWIMDPEGNKIELWEPIDGGF